MAKTMEERTKASLERKLSKRIYSSEWKWRGDEFLILDRLWIRDFSVLIHIGCKIHTVRARMWLDEYGLPDREQVFEGNDAIKECVDWVVNETYQIYVEVTERVKPYVRGHEIYMSALQGNFIKEVNGNET